jgi:large subunit ribosomal protein L15
MKLKDILSQAGKHKPRKRRGRGTGSGHGKTSGRGSKGAGSRAGWKARLGKEGGQNPIFARIPKRGFSNARFRTVYQVVNVGDLNEFDDGARVDAAAMKQAGLIPDAGDLVKVLGDGELSRKLTVAASKFSASAAEKIGKAGGTVQTVEQA